MIKCLVLNGAKHVALLKEAVLGSCCAHQSSPFCPQLSAYPSSPCLEHLEVGPEGWTLGGPLAQC